MKISYSALVPSFKGMGAKFGQPHNSLSVVVIRTTLDAMYQALLLSAETKLIRFLKNQEEPDVVLSASLQTAACVAVLGPLMAAYFLA